MLNRYLFEVIFGTVMICGLVAAWELFIADSLL
jgi:hypothetical protein